MRTKSSKSNISNLRTFGVVDAVRPNEQVRVTLDAVVVQGGQAVEHRLSIRTWWLTETGDWAPGKGVQVPISQVTELQRILKDALRTVSKLEDVVVNDDA